MCMRSNHLCVFSEVTRKETPTSIQREDCGRKGTGTTTEEISNITYAPKHRGIFRRGISHNLKLFISIVLRSTEEEQNQER